MRAERWEYSGIVLEGVSLAGIKTCITLPQYSLAFDIANGLYQAFNMSTFLISHGHMDHAAGIPYIIAQKTMSSHRPPRFIMPESLVAPMEEIMRQWTLIEGHKYSYEFLGAKPGDEFLYKNDLTIRSFPTIHRIPSLGYSLCRKFRKLKPELEGVSTEDIVHMRKEGKDPTVEKEELLVSFTGDTQIEFLDHSPEILKSKILILETTYLDERKSIASAKEWGHTHLNELIPRLKSIQSEKILLIHTSARYSLKEAQEELFKRLPEHERDRVELFQGR